MTPLALDAMRAMFAIAELAAVVFVAALAFMVAYNEAGRVLRNLRTRRRRERAVVRRLSVVEPDELTRRARARNGGVR